MQIASNQERTSGKWLTALVVMGVIDSNVVKLVSLHALVSALCVLHQACKQKILPREKIALVCGII